MNLIEKVAKDRKWQANLVLKTVGWLKIPMLRFIGAKVTLLDDSACEVVVPLKRATKNHLGSMYFAALAAGADTAAGLSAVLAMIENKSWIHLSFKNFHADFYKRAEGDVRFRCESVGAVKQLVRRAVETKERVEMVVPVHAYVEKFKEPVAYFELTLSLKKKSGF